MQLYSLSRFFKSEAPASIFLVANLFTCFQVSQGSLSCRVLLRVMLVMFTSASSFRLVKWWCRVVRTCSSGFGALSRESVPSHYQVTAWLSQTLTSSTRARISYQSASLYLLNLSLCTLTALLHLK